MMTTAEELRMWANKAFKEGGILYFSDWYLNALASRAEVEQSENTKLREYAKMYFAAVSGSCDFCLYCDPLLCDVETNPMHEGCKLWEEMRKLGIEVK